MSNLGYVLFKGVMQMIKIVLLVVVLIAKATSKPTFDVIADIIHDFVHDPNLPPKHPVQYAHNSEYTLNGYTRPGYTQAEYGYNYPPQSTSSVAFYPNNLPHGYYVNSPQGAYYPPIGKGNYAPIAIYDNQGYYKGPAYAANPKHPYNYRNEQYGLRGY